VPGKFLGIFGQDHSDSKSNRLHVHVFQFCFYSFEVYSTDSSDSPPRLLVWVTSEW
jgi:hypothetical protein